MSERADEDVAYSTSTETPEATGRASDEKETGRVEAFSDGIFAVAITLLVLEIPHPDTQHTRSLLEALGKPNLVASYVAYVLSFATILIMWVNHHAVFKLIKHTDHFFLMLNGLLLLVITFINYPTTLLAEYYSRPLHPYDRNIAALLYSGTFTVMAVLYNLVWRYASGRNRLLGRDADRQQVEMITRQYRFGPLFYLVAFALAFFSVELSLAVGILLAVYFIFTGRPPKEGHDATRR